MNIGHILIASPCLLVLINGTTLLKKGKGKECLSFIVVMMITPPPPPSSTYLLCKAQNLDLKLMFWMRQPLGLYALDIETRLINVTKRV